MWLKDEMVGYVVYTLGEGHKVLVVHEARVVFKNWVVYIVWVGHKDWLGPTGPG